MVDFEQDAARSRARSGPLTRIKWLVLILLSSDYKQVRLLPLQAARSVSCSAATYYNVPVGEALD